MTGAGPGEERPQLRLPQDGGRQQRPVSVRQQLRESREGGGG